MHESKSCFFSCNYDSFSHKTFCNELHFKVDGFKISKTGMSVHQRLFLHPPLSILSSIPVNSLEPIFSLQWRGCSGWHVPSFYSINASRTKQAIRLDKVVVILQPNHYRELAVTQPPNQCVRTSSLASPASSAGKRIIFSTSTSKKYL